MSNNKKIVNISIRDKRAVGDGTKFVCDNSDYVLHFDFDKEWDGKDPKTARLVYGSKFIDIPFIGNEAEIERTPVSSRYSIGVYAGDIKTSTPAIFECDYSILSTNPFHAPIPEDVYNQIMELIGKVDDAIIDADALPTDDFKPNTFYRVKGKLYYRVGNEWSEIATNFFDFVNRGDFDEAVESLSDSIKKLEEADTAKGNTLTAHGEKLAEHTEKLAQLDEAGTAQDEKIKALEEADKAKGAKIVALEEADTSTGETLDNHGERIAKAEEDLIVAKNDIVLTNAKVGQIYSVANNSLSTANIALTDVRAEESRAKDAEVALEGRIGEVESLAKGANKSLTYSNYATMIATLNSASREQYNVGQNILIVTLNVPDLWVSEVVNLPSVYTYTTDEAFTELLKQDGSVQVGYYKVSALETGKVDLTEYATKSEVKAVDDKLVDYVKNTDYATPEKAGVVKVGSNNFFDAIYIDGDGALHLGNDTDLIAQRVSGLPIRNQDLDYAVKEGVTNNDETLTEEEKTKACAWLGAVRPTDYATGAVGGTVKVSDGDTGSPLYRNPNGILKLGNYNYIIDAKTGENAVRNKDIDYAVMKALTDPIQHEWTDTEKTSARGTLGAVGDTDYATDVKAGVVKVSHGNFTAPLYRNNSGQLLLGNSADLIAARADTNAIRNCDLEFAVREALWDCRTIEWEEKHKYAARSLLGIPETINTAIKKAVPIGEWIEATKISATSYQIKLYESGVYEYFYYLNNPSPQSSRHYSNMLVYDMSAITDYMVLTSFYPDDKFARLEIQMTSNEEEGAGIFIYLADPDPEGFSPTSNVVIKARKIRDI